MTPRGLLERAVAVLTLASTALAVASLLWTPLFMVGVALGVLAGVAAVVWGLAWC